MSTVLWLVGFTGVMFVVGWALARWLSTRGSKEYGVTADALTQVSALTLDEAASRAIPLLSDERIFRCIAAPAGQAATLPDTLAPNLRDVLSRYDIIEFVGGPPTSLIPAQVAVSRAHPGFIRIGSVAGADTEGELAVLPSEETVYELYPDEEPDPIFGTYRSIYHWVLAMALEAQR